MGRDWEAERREDGAPGQGLNLKKGPGLLLIVTTNLDSLNQIDF